MVFVLSLVIGLIIACIIAISRLELELGFFALKNGSDDQLTIHVSLPPLVHRQISYPVAELVEKHGQLATRLLRQAEDGPRQEYVYTLAEQQQLFQRLKTLIQQIRQSGFLRIKKSTDRQLRWTALGAAIVPNLHITVKELVLQSRLGLGDAALTGIGVGLVWSLLGLATSLAQKHFQHLQFAALPRISITPVFNEWLIQGRLRCIVSLRVGEIIFEGAKYLIRSRTLMRRDASGNTTSH